MTAFIVLIPAALLLLWLLWANKALVLSEYELKSARLPEEFDGFTIAQVSDLHNAVFSKDNGELLELLRSAKPDIIAVTGDLVDSRHTDMDAAAGFIARAAAIAPVYYVTGNHESRLDFSEIEQRLLSAGAVVLRNESVTLSRGDAGITLAGIDDPSFVKTGGDAAERARTELDKLELDGSFTVLLAHRPELFEVCARYADVVLSGHAHGGQVRLPFIGGLYAPGQGFLPEYDAGVYTTDGCTLVVSRGLGNSLFPLRVNNRPELVTVTLRRA